MAGMEPAPSVQTADGLEPSPAAVGADAAVSMAYRDHHAALFAFLRRATRDEAAAEDLLQETFIRLLTVVREGRPPEQVGPWLYRVASNLVISRGRRATTALRWFTRHGPDEHRRMTTESPESRVLRHEQTKDLEAAVGFLSPDARVAVLLSGQGFSGAEIASAIGRTEAATRTLLCRSRTQIRARMAKQEADR